MYGEQARFFQDEIHQDLKHKKKGMMAMASAFAHHLHKRCLSFICLSHKIQHARIPHECLQLVIAMHMIHVQANLLFKSSTYMHLIATRNKRYKGSSTGQLCVTNRNKLLNL